MSGRVRHIVMWRLRGPDAAARREQGAALRAAFESLRGRVPGLLHLEVGLDHSRIDYACDAVLCSEFESQAALDGYATHPEHLRVKQLIGDMRVARHQVDYRVD